MPLFGYSHKDIEKARSESNYAGRQEALHDVKSIVEEMLEHLKQKHDLECLPRLIWDTTKDAAGSVRKLVECNLTLSRRLASANAEVRRLGAQVCEVYERLDNQPDELRNRLKELESDLFQAQFDLKHCRKSLASTRESSSQEITSLRAELVRLDNLIVEYETKLRN